MCLHSPSVGNGAAVDTRIATSGVVSGASFFSGFFSYFFSSSFFLGSLNSGGLYADSSFFVRFRGEG